MVKWLMGGSTKLHEIELTILLQIDGSKCVVIYFNTVCAFEQMQGSWLVNWFPDACLDSIVDCLFAQSRGKLVEKILVGSRFKI